MHMAEKIDLLKQMKPLYSPGKDPVVVDVPEMNFLMIDGHGDPNSSPEYQAALEGLFSLAYTLKFAYKKAEGVDYGVMPAEGLWWVEDMRLFTSHDKSNWDWTMMIAQPDFISAEWVERARSAAVKKKDLPALSKIRFEAYSEGLSMQLMHIGPFAAEGPNIARIHACIEQQGYELHGKHHEIYLSDFRKATPEKLRTVIRQPMRSKG
jgi:hypothetical protein